MPEATESKRELAYGPARTEDIAGIEELLNAQKIPGHFRAAILFHAKEHAKGNDYYTFVARTTTTPSRVVGVASMYPLDPKQKDVITLSKIFVHPDFRKGEAADRLIEQRVHHALNALKATRVLVHIDTAKAKSKYEKFGFTFSHRTPGSTVLTGTRTARK